RVEPAIARTARDDHRATGDVAAVLEANDEVTGLLAEPCHRARRSQVGAELLRLDERSLGELATGDTERKTEVVLDTRACARLPPDSQAVDAQRSQPFGRAVQRSRETRRTATDDDEIEAAVGQTLERQPEVLRELADARVSQHGAGSDDDGEVIDCY